MFDNKDFYPTPPEVIEQMLAPFKKESYRSNSYGSRAVSYYELNNRQILEPSAGKGNILDYLKEKAGVNPRNLYAIEQDPELVHD